MHTYNTYMYLPIPLTKDLLLIRIYIHNIKYTEIKLNNADLVWVDRYVHACIYVLHNKCHKYM